MSLEQKKINMYYFLKIIASLLLSKFKHEFSCHSFLYPFNVLFLLFFIISGSLLLDSLLSYLTTPERQNCKAVYLHVLTTNSAAMQFYERKHFSQFRFLPLYYAINGSYKDGFSYVLYINGGEPPWTLAYPFKSSTLFWVRFL